MWSLLAWSQSVGVAETESLQIVDQGLTIPFDPEQHQGIWLDDDTAEPDHVSQVVELLDECNRVRLNRVCTTRSHPSMVPDLGALVIRPDSGITPTSLIAG